MVDKVLQDAVTGKQEIFRIVRDKDILDLFSDTNLNQVLSFLRKGPMTVKDLEKAFKDAGDEKSDKTIYRYLNNLEKVDLVIQGGKRLLSGKGNKIKTQTLYMRTAKVFLMDYSQVKSECSEEKLEKYKKGFQIIGLLLSKHFGGSEFSADELITLREKITARETEILEQILSQADEKVTELMKDLDFDDVQMVIKEASFLALIAEKNNWESELKKILK